MPLGSEENTTPQPPLKEIAKPKGLGKLVPSRVRGLFSRNRQAELPSSTLAQQDVSPPSAGEEPTDRRFSIVGTRDRDSLGTSKWKEYLDKDRLLDAWSPPAESPYQGFFKTKTIEAIDTLTPIIKPRYSEAEFISERGIQNLIEIGNTGKDTAVVLDSGHAHSVAMAVKLAESGYQPVVMLDSIPHPAGVNRSEQGLATLLYFAERVKQLKAEGIIKADSPPVFVLDTHREGHPPRIDEIDNSYTYVSTDFPTAEQLKQNGITKVVYLNEGDQHGKVLPDYQSPDRLGKDLKAITRAWEEGGIKMLYTGVSPSEGLFSEKGSATRSISRQMLKGFSPMHGDRNLSYDDMSPSVYGKESGVAMHRNRLRYLLSSDGKLQVINEQGTGREMTGKETEQFKSEIGRQVSAQPDDPILAKFYNNFPHIPKQ